MKSTLIGTQEMAGGWPVEAASIVTSIGNTPLEPVYLVIQDAPRKVHLKLEGANITGSMKDRTGLGLITHLEQQGKLHAGSVIIESTSGNLGVALALLCKSHGYQFIAVVDPKTTAENLRKMQALGARIELVDQPDQSGGYLLSRLARIQELCQRQPEYIWTDQYSSPANPYAHYSGTGPEIYHQMRGIVDAVFVPVSTGGTLAGIGRYFREVSPTTRIIGVDAWGSVVFGGPPAQRKLTGIGSSRTSAFITPHSYDAYLLIKDEEAFAFCRLLFSATGIKVGGSSGATLAACARYLQNHPELRHVVCICADRGDNYSSSIFCDAWLQQHGLHLTDAHLGAVQDVFSIHRV